MSVFINSYVIVKEPAEIYIGYLIFFVLLPIFIFRYGFPSHLVIIFSVLLIAGIFNIFLGNNNWQQFVKIFLGLFFSYLFYYYVVVQSDYNVEKLFQLYLKGCYIVALIGAIQFISFQIGFTPGYDYRWIFNKWGVIPGGAFGIRINSVFGEPTYFATCVSAGACVALYNLLVKSPYYLSKFQSALILIIYLLSYSGVAYTALLLTFVVLLLNFGFIRYVLIFLPILIGVFYYLYNTVPEFRERYDSTVNVFSTGQYTIGKTHGSSIILYDNYQVALKNFSSNFLIGTGLGSHPVAFDRYSDAKHIEVYGFAQNYQDASSMLLRLISETGIFGTFLMLLILFKCFVKKSIEVAIPDHFWIISASIFVLITVNLLRQGNYFLNGFPLFVWLYYYNYLNYKKYVREMSEHEKISENVIHPASA